MSRWSIQRLLQEHLDGYLQQHGMTIHQHKAVQSLMQCRTARMGSHAQYCEAGHLQGVYYNSCHHRACPQCQALRRERWLVSRESMLLDCVHHHWVFTLTASTEPVMAIQPWLVSGCVIYRSECHFKAADSRSGLSWCQTSLYAGSAQLGTETGSASTPALPDGRWWPG